MPNPFFFVVGCPRSGTTLLMRMLDAHPRIAVIDETQWFVTWFEKRQGVTPDGFVTPELVKRLLDKDRTALFREFDLRRRAGEMYARVGSGREILHADFVSMLFDWYGQARGKTIVGTKNPDYVRRFSALRTLWPKAKVIHLVRDGRDVCLSSLQWSRGGQLVKRFARCSEDPVSSAALWWEWHVQLGREAAEDLGSNQSYEIRYEALVTRPESECRALCGFLGVPFAESMIAFHEGRTRNDPALDAKHAWLPPTPGLRDWRTQMVPESIERFEAVAGDLLEILGYPRTTKELSLRTTERASRMRNQFTSVPLPHRW
jgi:hypothetical protein